MVRNRIAMPRHHGGFLIASNKYLDDYKFLGLQYRGLDRSPEIWGQITEGNKLVNLFNMLISAGKKSHFVKSFEKAAEIATQLLDYEDVEIIECCLIPSDVIGMTNEESMHLKREFLGFDVSSTDDFSAILNGLLFQMRDRFPDYLMRLNNNGLFNALEDAARFKEAYLKEPDGEHPDVINLELWAVYKVEMEMGK